MVFRNDWRLQEVGFQDLITADRWDGAYYGISFIIKYVIRPTGQCTLQSLCILIIYLAINATVWIRLYNRLTPWQFIKQISGKDGAWNKQLIPYHSTSVFMV